MMLEANRCKECCNEMETHPVDDEKQYCPSCAVDDSSSFQIINFVQVCDMGGESQIRLSKKSKESKVEVLVRVRQ